MNKISCDVIRDLLPLYKDDVCSEKSKDLIEGHLPECEDCREYLDALNSELPPVTLAQDGTGAKNGNESGSSASDGIETLRRISRQINWLKVVVVLSAAIMVFVVSTSLSLVKEYNPELYLFDRRVAVEDMQMTELYQLENGDFYITLESEHPCSPISYGDRIDSPDSEYSESYDNGESRLDSQTYSFVVPAEETVGQEEIFPDDSDFWDFPAAVHKNSFIYYQGKHNKRFTIWKEGQEIMPAPASVEKRVQEELEMKEQGTRDSSGHEDILFLY